jgi:hypothetical protein
VQYVHPDHVFVEFGPASINLYLANVLEESAELFGPGEGLTGEDFFDRFPFFGGREGFLCDHRGLSSFRAGSAPSERLRQTVTKPRNRRPGKQLPRGEILSQTGRAWWASRPRECAANPNQKPNGYGEP